MGRSRSSTCVSDRTADALVEWRKSIDAELDRVAMAGDPLPPQLRDAIRYSLTGEGKRFRGLLLMASFNAVHPDRAGNGADASALAAAIEIVHAYSLVHDDLPCMDNDSMRRGMPTTHRAHGVGVATVAGVAMVPIAVRQVITACDGLGLDHPTTTRIVAELMAASGAGGMVGGQLLDLLAENAQLSMAELEQVH